MSTIRAVIVAGVVAVGAVAAGVGIAGYDGPADPRPRTDDATALLGQFFDLTQHRDSATFCSRPTVLSADMCKHDWSRSGDAAGVPTQPPRVLSTRSEKDLVVLRVCGVDGRGQPYLSDFVVEQTGARTVVPFPVFWAGKTYSGTVPGGQPEVVQARPPGSPQPGCP
jgi:hypothetical protein